jgi:hypothetical protein
MGLGCGRPRRRGRGLARCRGLRGRGKRVGRRFAFMRRLRFFESWTGRRARCPVLLWCSGGRVGLARRANLGQVRLHLYSTRCPEMLVRRSGSRAVPMVDGELSMAHMPKRKRSLSSESALSPTLESSASRRHPQIMQAYSHQHVHICERFHCCVSVARHDLIRDAPDAAPRIVDVVADSPRVSDLRAHRPVFPTGKHNTGCRDLPRPVQQPCTGSAPATATQLPTSRPLWYSTWSNNYQTFLQVNLASPRRSISA